MEFAPCAHTWTFEGSTTYHAIIASALEMSWQRSGRGDDVLLVRKHEVHVFGVAIEPGKYGLTMAMAQLTQLRARQ
jgi:hypothetical protein